MLNRGRRCGALRSSRLGRWGECAPPPPNSPLDAPGGNPEVLLLATGSERLTDAEATLPDLASHFLLLTGLVPNARYDLQATSGFAPGSPVWRLQTEANDAGVIQAPWDVKDVRLRVRAQGVAERSAR